MNDFETVLRRMIETRKEMVEENKGHIEDALARNIDPKDQVRCSFFFYDRVVQFEEEIDLLRAVFLAAGVEY